MFCPDCRAEFRSGVTHCSDSRVALIEAIPPRDVRDPAASENEAPDAARPRYFLAWFVPMAVFVLLFFAVAARPALFNNNYVAAILITLILAHNLGAFWMLYQAVRYENRVLKYVAMAFIPFMFIWYALVRLLLRKEIRKFAVHSLEPPRRSGPKCATAEVRVLGLYPAAKTI